MAHWDTEAVGWMIRVCEERLYSCNSYELFYCFVNSFALPLIELNVINIGLCNMARLQAFADAEIGKPWASRTEVRPEHTGKLNRDIRLGNCPLDNHSSICCLQVSATE